MFYFLVLITNKTRYWKVPSELKGRVICISNYESQVHFFIIATKSEEYFPLFYSNAAEAP